jgi:hypothetical protein
MFPLSGGALKEYEKTGNVYNDIMHDPPKGSEKRSV